MVPGGTSNVNAVPKKQRLDDARCRKCTISHRHTSTISEIRLLIFAPRSSPHTIYIPFVVDGAFVVSDVIHNVSITAKAIPLVRIPNTKP